MDIAQLQRRLEEAATTLANLPGGHPGPDMPRSSMPEVLQSYFDAYGRTPARSRRPVPPSESIDAMDEALAWLTTLRRLPAPSEAERVIWSRVIWARANRYSFQAIADRLGAHGVRMSGKTVQRRHEVAMGCLLRIANRSLLEAAA